MGADDDPRKQARVRRWLKEEAAHLARVNPSDRPWELPFAAALAMGLPLLAGAGVNRMDLGLAGSLAGLGFLYLPEAGLGARMRRLGACGAGMTVCFLLGLLCHQMPGLLVPMITVVTMVAVFLSRRNGIGPPGSLFFVMSAAIGAFSPVNVERIPEFAGAFAAAAISVCGIGLLYHLATSARRPPKAAVASGERTATGVIVHEAVVAGIFTGLSLWLAQVLDLQRAYWVPVSCIVVIQGASLRAVWTKKAQRLAGTVMGLGVAWVLLLVPFDPWRVSLMVMGLAFAVEVIVVRQYALAVILITPLSILLAEAATAGHGPVWPLVLARLVDTALGCVVGFCGGVVMYQGRKWFNSPVSRGAP